MTMSASYFGAAVPAVVWLCIQIPMHERTLWHIIFLDSHALHQAELHSKVKTQPTKPTAVSSTQINRRLMTAAENQSERVTLDPESNVRHLYPIKFDKNAPVHMGLEEIPLGSHVPAHSHPDHDEVVFVHRGSVRVILDGSERVLEEGQAVFFARGSTHSIWPVGPTDPAWITWQFTPRNLDFPCQ
jgi:quercetin dioxygenase-like cupin family protein